MGAFPNPILLGEQVVGTAITQEVVLRSRTGQPFQVLEIEPDSSSIEVQQVLGGAGEPLYRVTVLVSEEGSDQNDVRFRVRKEDGGEEQVVLRVWSYGVSAGGR